MLFLLFGFKIKLFKFNYALPLKCAIISKRGEFLWSKNYLRTLYATEAKPPRETSPETIFRMISEILTYTVDDSQYKKAIIFFENSPQDREYMSLNKTVKDLIQVAEITVFKITKNNKGIIMKDTR